MHRTVEAIVHPDGRVETLETVAVPAPRRALLTIRNESPMVQARRTDDDPLDALLAAAGLQETLDEIATDMEPLSEAALDTLWARIPQGTPPVQIIGEERDEAR